MNTSRFKIISPADLANYRERPGEISGASWLEFMLHDPVANENWHELFDRFSEYQYVVPGPLKPVEMNVEKNKGVYIEPNVWMVHEIG